MRIAFALHDPLPQPTMTRDLELWMGPEASVTRVGATRIDQLEATGFAHRLDDLDRMAALGARAVRLPLLFERLEPQPDRCDYAWAEERLARLRALGVRPIAGLVHHGSGPLHTSLVDPGFADKVAGFAARLAERFPWVDDWTPINEPLTTARFGSLYGVWHPHARDDATFVRTLLNQIQATAAAMRAVRRVNPAARLVQTEDLGHCSGTPTLAAQVAFENERRWLSYDLLVGRVTPDHPLHGWLVERGADPDELAGLAAEPTPPAVVGVNVYVTSERYLDHRLGRYPEALHGGNGVHRYADTEAVRVRQASFGGFAVRLREAWERYRLPVALTEVHLSCTREEQLRWLDEAWTAALQLRADGADVRAVTAWSAFGAYDWNRLLAVQRGDYELGLFDVRNGTPRPTALATLASELGQGRAASHPVVAVPGWWRRDDRFLYPPQPSAPAPESPAPAAGRPLVVVGGNGTLANAFVRICRRRAIACRVLRHSELDISDAAAVWRTLAAIEPWAVVNAAGFVRVDAAEADASQWRANALGPVVLAAACEALDARLLTFSSDLVFDGGKRRPYVESDDPSPLNAYGRAKRHAEVEIASQPHVLVVRTAAFFGPWDTANFAWRGLERIRQGFAWAAADDRVVSPTYVPDLVDTGLDLLIDAEAGLWHVTNAEATSWFDFACRIAEAAALPRHLVRAEHGADRGQAATRPPYSALTSERGVLAPRLDDAVERFLVQTPGLHR